jgi:hypothetical protein
MLLQCWRKNRQKKLYFLRTIFFLQIRIYLYVFLALDTSIFVKENMAEGSMNYSLSVPIGLKSIAILQKTSS